MFMFVLLIARINAKYNLDLNPVLTWRSQVFGHVLRPFSRFPIYRAVFFTRFKWLDNVCTFLITTVIRIHQRETISLVLNKKFTDQALNESWSWLSPVVQIRIWVQLVFWTGKVCFLFLFFLKIELKTGLTVKMETCSDIKMEVLVHVMFNCQISCGKMRIFTREQWSVQRNIHAEFQSIENKRGTCETTNKTNNHDGKATSVQTRFNFVGEK